MLGNQIAGGAWRGSDDGAIALNQSIEKGRLTRVRSAYDCQGQPLTHDATVGEGLFECDQRRLNRRDLRGDFAGWKKIDVVFGEVDASFEVVVEGYKLLFFMGYLAGERASQLLGGDSCLVKGCRFNEVVDGFGLGEV